MKTSRLSTNLTLAAVVAASAWAATVVSAPAEMRSMSGSMSVISGQSVNVQVGFNTELPLADDSEQTLLSAQQSGRRVLYEMASKECALLQATIAKTCRLTNLNISAQVRRRSNTPTMLAVRGNARFAITLKDDESK